jgi:hypothetical protein
VTAVPADNYAPTLAGADRPEIPPTGDERAVLTALLDWHRATFEAKCLGVPPGRLAERGVPPSTLSLHGLVRHLAGVERWWFGIQLAGEDLPMLFYSDDDPDQDFVFADADADADLDLWRRECERSRAIVATRSLDDTGTRRRDGATVSLRFVLAHLVAEYARHNGHADLLRERIDGVTGA